MLPILISESATSPRYTINTKGSCEDPTLFLNSSLDLELSPKSGGPGPKATRPLGVWKTQSRLEANNCHFCLWRPPHNCPPKCNAQDSRDPKLSSASLLTQLGSSSLVCSPGLPVGGPWWVGMSGDRGCNWQPWLKDSPIPTLMPEPVLVTPQPYPASRLQAPSSYRNVKETLIFKVFGLPRGENLKGETWRGELGQRKPLPHYSQVLPLALAFTSSQRL